MKRCLIDSCPELHKEQERESQLEICFQECFLLEEGPKTFSKKNNLNFS